MEIHTDLRTEDRGTTVAAGSTTTDITILNRRSKPTRTSTLLADTHLRMVKHRQDNVLSTKATSANSAVTKTDPGPRLAEGTFGRTLQALENGMREGRKTT